jgi:arabinan endo-1,5-alpha-L-arabinosidase
LKKFINLFIILFLLIGSFSLVGCGTPNDEPTNGPVEPPTPVEPTYEYVRTTYQNHLKFYTMDGNEYFVDAADPDVLKADDGYFYMYCTNTYCEMGKKGMAYDRGPIFRSKDLVNWTWVGSVFDGYSHALDWGDKNAGVWAPSVIKVGDNYCYYYSLSLWGDSNPGIGVATSPTPYGPWTHHGKLLDSVTSGVKNSIDPQPIYYEGKLYLIWGSFFGIGAVELTDDGTEVFWGMDNMKDYVTYLIPDNSGGEMDIEINYEGSYVIERNGEFFYFGSQGTCCSGRISTYRVKVGKADNLFGPYYGSDNETLDKGTYGDLVIGPSDLVAGTGHNTVVEDYAGEYWLFYHGYDVNGDNPDKRTIFMDKILWDEKTGMPYVENYEASINKDILGPTVRK